MEAGYDLRDASSRPLDRSMRPSGGAQAGTAGGAGADGLVDASAEALEFVRFCYRRRAVAWPQLYDEMCAVAARGEFNGWGYRELAEHGIEFGLPKLPRLAALAGRVALEEPDRRRVRTRR